MCADQLEQTRVIRERAVSLKRQELKTVFQTGGAAVHKKMKNRIHDVVTWCVIVGVVVIVKQLSPVMKICLT